MATFRAPALSVALMALVLMWASADMAPDAALLSNKVGDVVSAEYRFPPEIDTLVLPNVVIEMCVGARCVCLCLPHGEILTPQSQVGRCLSSCQASPRPRSSDCVLSWYNTSRASLGHANRPDLARAHTSGWHRQPQNLCRGQGPL